MPGVSSYQIYFVTKSKHISKEIENINISNLLKHKIDFFDIDITKVWLYIYDLQCTR